MRCRGWFRGRLFLSPVLLVGAAVWLGFGAAGQQAANSTRPLSPKEELATFRVAKGFRVEIGLRGKSPHSPATVPTARVSESS